jgi:hypothetical protein
MYDNPIEENTVNYWKPEVKYSYKCKDMTQKINTGKKSETIEIEAHFRSYDLANKEELESTNELDFLCYTVLYKVDSQEFGSNFVKNCFADTFEIRDKKNGFKLVGEMRWDNQVRSFVPSFTSAAPIRVITCLIGIDAAEREIEIDLPSSVSTDLLRRKTGKPAEINPKAEIMFNNVAIKLEPEATRTLVEGLGTIKLLMPSKGSLDIDSYKEKLEALRNKIEKTLKKKEGNNDEPEFIQEEEIAF